MIPFLQNFYFPLLFKVVLFGCVTTFGTSVLFANITKFILNALKLGDSFYALLNNTSPLYLHNKNTENMIIMTASIYGVVLKKIIRYYFSNYDSIVLHATFYEY